MKDDDLILSVDTQHELQLPIFDGMIQAGFPSPLQGIGRETIDLNRELIDHPSSTFCARVSGNSMIEAGVSDGDLLLIDKSKDVSEGAIAVCFIDGEFTLKRVSVRHDGVYLVPANAKFKEIFVSEDSNFQIWGIVTYIIKSAK